MPSPELKPCPFCGEDEEVSTSERNYGLFVRRTSGPSHDGGEWEFFDVECNNCGCSLSIGAPSRDEAIAVWNRRAGEDEKEMKRRYRVRTRCRYFHGGEYGYSLCSLGSTSRIFIDSDCNGVCNCYEERRKSKKKDKTK